MPDFRKNIYKLILSTIECLSKKGKENSMNFLVKKGLKVDFKQVGQFYLLKDQMSAKFLVLH